MRLNRRWPACCIFAVMLARALPAAAQQRPLLTEDPEPIGAGRILLEGGVQYSKDQKYPVSGLQGSLWRLPTLGVSFGLSSIAEFQLDGSVVDHLLIDHRDPRAPLAHLVDVSGDSTSDVGDITVATKIRFSAETENEPAFALRFATKLPNASNESGLGTDAFEFSGALLGAKTVQSVRFVGNVGFSIVADPTDGQRQNDVIIYGVSLARALTTHTEIVGEGNGRFSTRAGEAFPGSESRSLLNFGARYTRGPLRVDGSVFFGLLDVDPSFGFTGGFTYVMNAFHVP